MTNNEFDKIFRDKLGAHSEPVDDGLWAAIESSMAAQSVLGKPVAGESATDKSAVLPFGKRVAMAFGSLPVRKIGYSIASVAAVLLIALFLFKPADSAIEQGVVLAESAVEIEPEEYCIALEEDVVQDESVSESVGNAESVTVEVVEKTVSAKRESDAANLMANAVPVEVATEKDKAVEDEKMAVGKRAEEKEAKVKDVVAKEEKYIAENDSDNLYDWNYVESQQKRNRKEYTIAFASNMMARNNISVSPEYVSVMTAAGISHTDAYLQAMEIISEANYSLPVNIGVQAQVKVNDFLSVGIGVNYTWLKSKYDGLINKKVYHVKQSLHYIGIPVNAYFTLLNKKNLYLYANIGGAIEKGVKASYKLSSYDGSMRETSAEMDGFQYSANAGLGLEYRFVDFVGLYLEPNVVYYFDSQVPASIRTDQPLQVKAEVGFRFHIK